MEILVIGTGYVGLVSGACFAQMGNKVTCIDNNVEKIANLKNGIMPIYEPGLERIVHASLKNNSLTFSSTIAQSIHGVDVIIIAVGTPMGDDGSADLKQVLSVAKNIGDYLGHYTVIVDKSTVPVGTADLVKNSIQTQLDMRKSGIDFDVVSNPEFLKEGDAIADFLSPDRVIVGSDSKQALSVLRELYAPFMKNNDRFIAMDVRSAEMTKYAANAMLATKISFINEISNICELVGADVNKVRKGIGSDNRIGTSFIYPGCGYGGSCFPKDVQALVKTANDLDYNPLLLNAVETVNNQQKQVLVKKIVKHFGNDLTGKTFAIWGLSFKPGTDDMRQAPAIIVINELTNRGAKVRAFDPQARKQAESHYLSNNPNICYADDKYHVLNNADALVLITEWQEFRSPDFKKIKKLLKTNLFFDGRNQFEKTQMKQHGFNYIQIGVIN